jgi:hypothetical protein
VCAHAAGANIDPAQFFQLFSDFSAIDRQFDPGQCRIAALG